MPSTTQMSDKLIKVEECAHAADRHDLRDWPKAADMHACKRPRLSPAELPQAAETTGPESNRELLKQCAGEADDGQNVSSSQAPAQATSPMQ